MMKVALIQMYKLLLVAFLFSTAIFAKDLKPSYIYKASGGVIDIVNDYTLAFSNYEPAVGTLMRGSIWHILNAIYISLHKTSIDEYKNILDLLKEEIKRYKLN